MNRYAQAKNTTEMIRKLHFLILIFIVFLSGFDCKSQEQTVIATLIKNDRIDSILNTFIYPDGSIIDLKLCIENYEYPPKIPQNIYWMKPDTSTLSETEKFNLAIQYFFDSEGKLTGYFYQGSLISGIFPLLYSFKYNNDFPSLISEIDDKFYSTKYLIKYDKEKNVQCIEKLDSTDKRIEILTIKIK